MAFQFGFGGEDSDDDGVDTVVDGAHIARDHTATSSAGETYDDTAKEHHIADLLSLLPERIAYSTVRVESPSGKVVFVPRRELFDVRIQLIAEGPDNDQVVDHLEKSDLRSGVYEGGFKTWECSIDLASLLLDRGLPQNDREQFEFSQVIELGAGTALPSLVLFAQAFSQSIPTSFVLADYNDAVLRLVTLPNLLLAWATISGRLEPDVALPEQQSNGDLEITAELTETFRADLAARNITLTFLSGSWSMDLADLMPRLTGDAGMLVLAAETIYSPASTEAFVDLLLILLGRGRSAMSMIAAKRMYFGVGGSVDGLKDVCHSRGAVATEIEDHGVPGLDSGVGRALLEVKLQTV